jgi:hypothetical protein
MKLMVEDSATLMIMMVRSHKKTSKDKGLKACQILAKMRLELKDFFSFFFLG